MKDRIDLLNRTPFVEQVLMVINQLAENRRGCCFTIEGSWGIGKTFVIEDIEDKLKSDDNEQYFVFHYNCWKYDYYDEPIVAIISSMLASIQEDEAAISPEIDGIVDAGYKLAFDKIKEIAGAYTEAKFNINIVELIESVIEQRDLELKNTYEFDELYNFNQTILTVRNKLKEIAKERTLVLVVDELDRCVPAYAIKVLERLHHIFRGLENVVVILAVDRKQLEHSVEEMFGRGAGALNVDKYLKKFIDFSMVLDNGKLEASLEEKYSFYFDRFTSKNELAEMEELHAVFSEMFQGIDIRSQEKIFEKANMVHSIVCSEDTNADLSLLAFEITYEVMRYHGIIDISEFIHNNGISIQISSGKYFNNIWKSVEQNFTTGTIKDPFNDYKTWKNIKDSLYGKVLWLFDRTFSIATKYLYVDRDKITSSIQEEIGVAKKYVGICEVIR